MVKSSVSHVFLSETEYQIIQESEEKGCRMVNKDKDNLSETVDSDEITDEKDNSKIKRRTVMKGAVAASAVLSMPMILTGIKRAEAASGPVKIGHIEDLSGNIAVYGVQKWHAAQLAVKEINEGKALKGGPVGSGGL